jgi:hypothetical protein
LGAILSAKYVVYLPSAADQFVNALECFDALLKPRYAGLKLGNVVSRRLLSRKAGDFGPAASV